MDSLTLQAGDGAFGDASHPTTALLLTVLDAIAPNLAPRAVCDMGAGSGILALRAAQLWPDATILAADLERSAVQAIAENAQHNGLVLHAVHSDGFRHPDIRAHAPYDLILMNILAEPVLRLLGDAEAMLAEGGVLMLSGLMEHQQEPILAAAQGLGLELSYRLKQEPWVAHLWQKP